MEGIPHKTLIIRFSSVGDIVLSTLLVRCIRRRFPDVQLDYLIKDEFADLIRHNPHLTRVLEFPAGGSLHDLSALRRRVTEEHYDLVIDIHDSLRSRFITAGLRTVARINKRKLARFLLVRCKWDTYRYWGGAPSVAERYLEPVRSLGVRDDGGGLEIFFPAETTAAAAELLNDVEPHRGMPIIGICPSAKHWNKMWPLEYFAETVISLTRTGPASFLLFGSADETDLCGDLEHSILGRSTGALVVNLAGRVSLLETAAIMDRCALVITNDSGLMHIAAARRRKVIAIFGPTVKEFGFFPFGTVGTVVEHPGLSCRPCTHIGLASCPKGHFKCMKEISPQTVVEAAALLLQ